MACAPCPVCCEPVRPNVQVNCASCDYVTCRPCARKYLLGLTADPRCMNCNHVWDREFLDGALGISFVNTQYKAHREGVLLDRERALLPATQDRLPPYREYKAAQSALPDKKRRLADLRRQAAELSEEVGIDINRLARLTRTTFRVGPAPLPDAPEPASKRIVRGCPVDACRGFLLRVVEGDADASAGLKCGTCGVKACGACHERVLDSNDHVCDDATVKAAMLITKTTKPCPSCATPTHRISGCNQMWCTICRTAWSWNTGEVDTGLVHNPHYHAWVSREAAVGQVGRAGRAGGDCYQWRALGTQLVQWGVPRGLTDALAAYHLRAGHIERVTLRQLPGNAEVDNMDLRLQYLDDEIDEETMKVLLQRREKKRLRDFALRQVLEMVVAATRDILLGMVADSGDMDRAAGLRSAKAAQSQLELLDGYADEQLAMVCKRFNVKPVKLDSLSGPNY